MLARFARLWWTFTRFALSLRAITALRYEGLRLRLGGQCRA